jgi:hypothetical protein
MIYILRAFPSQSYITIFGVIYIFLLTLSSFEWLIDRHHYRLNLWQISPLHYREIVTSPVPQFHDLLIQHATISKLSSSLIVLSVSVGLAISMPSEFDPMVTYSDAKFISLLSKHSHSIFSPLTIHSTLQFLPVLLHIKDHVVDLKVSLNKLIPLN